MSTTNGTLAKIEPAREIAPRREAVQTAFEPQSLGELIKFAEYMSECDLLPEALRNRPKHFVLVAIKGREMGFTIMQSIACINVIKGRAVLNSEGIAAKVLSHPDCVYFQPVETSAEVATYETLRRGAPSPVRISYTIDQAKRAGLTNGDNYRKHTEAMLRARCAMALGRAVFPDAVLGLNETSEGEEMVAQPERVHVAPIVDPLPPDEEPDALVRFREDVTSLLDGERDKLSYEQAATIWLDNKRDLESAGNEVAVHAWRELCAIVHAPGGKKTANAELRRACAIEQQKRDAGPRDDGPKGGGKRAEAAPANESDDPERDAIENENPADDHVASAAQRWIARAPTIKPLPYLVASFAAHEHEFGDEHDAAIRAFVAAAGALGTGPQSAELMLIQARKARTLPKRGKAA